MARILTPGTVLAGRYAIRTPLGRGGMARVYRARHLNLDREVALKVMRAPSEDPSFDERFTREAKNAARLDHAGCVRVLDSGRAAGVRFLAMDLLDGPSLRADLDERGTYDAGEAIAVARQLCAALAHAHARGVLHRDIKPENVVYADRDRRRAVLIDFGLSRLGDEHPLTATGSCVGSPSYLAPERLQQEPYDGRADLYALGVLLYELLAGRRPFRGKTSLAIAREHLEATPPPLRQQRPETPSALIALVERALAKSPDERFPDAASMLAALDRIDAPRRATHRSAAAARDGEENTYIVAEPPARSALRRAWAGLRFGRWRWRRRAVALPAAPTSSA